MSVGDFPPIDGIGAATAPRFIYAGADLATQIASNRTAQLDVGTYRLAPITANCRVRQGGSAVTALATDGYMNIYNYYTVRVTGAADDYIAAIREGGSDGILSITRVA
jgi:hypothetical protein